MKYGKRVTAFIIALVLTVYGLPVFPAAQASPADQETSDGFTLFNTEEESGPQAAEPEYPMTAMRFVQKVEYNEDGTVKRDENGNPVGGFDPSTGILTMCLQIKPEELQTGGKIEEGVFLFQTDLNTVVPVTRPKNSYESRQQILGRAGKGAIVTSSNNPEIKNLLGGGNFEQLSGSFGDLMSPAANFNSNHTGLLVARDTKDPSLLDCYFQFRFEGSSPAASTEAGDEGYVTVMEFDFQCYAGSYPVGTPNAGQPKPAESEDALFESSLRLPEESEIERICGLFSYEEGAAEPVAVTMETGAAALLRNKSGDTARYYGAEPVLSRWRKKIESTNNTYVDMPRDTWWSARGTSSLIAGSPELWYANMLVKYVVTGFNVGYENVFIKESESAPAGDSDYFRIPSSETEGYPRYVIPYLTRAAANDTAESWVPDAYLGTEGSAVKLKYFIGSEIMEGSAYSPEHEGIEKMLRNITWEFLLDGNKRLEECVTAADPVESQTLKISDWSTGTQVVKTWTAKTFLIEDSSLDSKYQGKKLWKMYDENGAYRMTCPVGIVMEMLPTTITYYDRYSDIEAEREEKQSVEALAPQLHVTNDAADPESAIWFVQPSASNEVTTAPVYFWACYDFAGADFHSIPLNVGIYRDKDSVPSNPIIDIGDIASDETEGIDGEFHVGKENLDGTGNETAQDAVATEGFTVQSVLQDQYGLVIPGKWNTLELVPTAETQAALEAAHRDKAGPFKVERKTMPPDSTEYTIKYIAGKNANDTVEGVYILRASYSENGVAVPAAEKRLSLSKPEDRLNYIKTTVLKSGDAFDVSVADPRDVGDGNGQAIDIICQIPYRKSSSTVTSISNAISLKVEEVANQWRIPNTYVYSIPAFDILPDLRGEDGKIDLADLMRRDDIKVHFESVKSVDGVTLNSRNGTVTYTNKVKDNSEFVFRLVAEYDGITKYLEYHMMFRKDELDINDIVIRPSADDIRVKVMVPEDGKAVTQAVTTVPKDQFLDEWNWTDVKKAYAAGGRLNPSGKESYNWELYPVEEKEFNGEKKLVPTERLPEGVTLTGENNAVIVVSPKAKDSKFQVKAVFARLDGNGRVVKDIDEDGNMKSGTVSSVTMTVVIERPPEKVSELRKLEYQDSTNTLISPEVTEGSEDLVVDPTFEVINQYGEEMSPKSSETVDGYEAVWNFTVKSTRQDVATDAEAAGYINVDKKTGALTVKKGAPDCTVDITVRATPSDRAQIKTVKVTVERGNLLFNEMRFTKDFIVDEERDKIEYPTVEAEGRTTQLKVEATSNYALDYMPVAVGELTWSLTSVTFANGDVYVNEDAAVKPAGAKTFSGSTANGSVSLSSSGVLNFISVTAKAKVPTSITATATSRDGAAFPLTITVPPIESTPYSLYFDPDHYKGIQLPKETEPPVDFTLVSELKDQYGLVLDQTLYPVTWSLPDGASLPQGVTATVDGNGVLTSKKIVVDHTVPVDGNGRASLQLIVTANGTSGDNSVRREVNILMAKDVTNLSVGSVRNLAFRNHPGNTLELPASKTGSGYTANVMTAVVCDEYGTPMGGAVTWNVESTTNGISARFTDKTGGVLRLNYTDEARDNNGGTITVKATSQTDSTKFATMAINVVLAESDPTYAVPTITDPGADAIEVSPGIFQPIVPTKNRPNDTVVELAALVCDQYGVEMAGEPATMKLAAASQSNSLKLVQNTTAGAGGADANTATLTISIGAKDSVTIEADLVGGTGTSQPGESERTFPLSKGPSYAYALQLAQNNEYSFELPTWQSSHTADAPAPMATKDIDIRAEVIDQNGVWFESESTRTYPIWEFVGDHEGIEFSDSMALEGTLADGSKRAKGEDLVLTVSSDAIKQEDPNKPVLTKDVVIRVTTKGHEGEEDFTAEKTLHFTRELPTAYRMYVDGVSGGVATEKLKRPTAEEGETVYRLTPRVYDQYGVEIKGAAVKVDMLTEAVEQQGIVVEAVYDEKDPVPPEGEADTRVPIGYSLYRVEQNTTPGEDDEPSQDGEDKDDSNRTLIGSFDRLTGEMKLYTASKTLTWLRLKASFAPLGDTYGTRQVRVEIQMDAAVPDKVVIGQLERIYYMQIVQQAEGRAAPNEEIKNTSELLWPLVYDQYGEEFEMDTDRLLVNWDLMVPNEDGTYTAYTEELGPDGLPRSGAELLVQKGLKRADNSVLITIQGAQFFEEKDLAVKCEVIDLGNGNKALTNISDFSVLEYKAGGPVVFDIEVTFDAGKYGKLVGPATIPVNAGQGVESPPGVKNIAGYGFVGWTADGETIVDPRQIPVFSSVTYYAVYKDITNTLFLEGYGNQARPNDLVTRAEFVSMVVRAMGGFDKARSYGDSFKDVKPGQWYTNTVAYAKKMGIVKGYTDGTFRPNDTITRAEAAQILFTAGGYVSPGTTGRFPDVTEGAWYEDAVEALTAAGVINGMTDGTYRPMSKLSRAEAVKLIVMITVNAPNELEIYNIRNFAYCPFKDVTKGHWAYVYILRAAGIA